MIAPAAAPTTPPASAAPAERPARPPMSAPVPPPINAPPSTRSCRALAHPASANAIAATTSVFRIRFSPANGVGSERLRLHQLLAARRPAPLVKPRAVLGHLRALRLRRTPLARRRFLAAARRAPPQLDAVVHVVRHLEIRRAVDHVFERERPWRAVAARIGKLARRKLRREHVLQFGLHVGDALALWH